MSFVVIGSMCLGFLWLVGLTAWCIRLSNQNQQAEKRGTRPLETERSITGQFPLLGWKVSVEVVGSGAFKAHEIKDALVRLGADPHMTPENADYSVRGNITRNEYNFPFTSAIHFTAGDREIGYWCGCTSTSQDLPGQVISKLTAAVERDRQLQAARLTRVQEINGETLRQCALEELEGQMQITSLTAR